MSDSGDVFGLYSIDDKYYLEAQHREDLLVPFTEVEIFIDDEEIDDWVNGMCIAKSITDESDDACGLSLWEVSYVNPNNANDICNRSNIALDDIRIPCNELGKTLQSIQEEEDVNTNIDRATGVGNWTAVEINDDEEIIDEDVDDDNDNDDNNYSNNGNNSNSNSNSNSKDEENKKINMKIKAPPPSVFDESKSNVMFKKRKKKKTDE